MLRFSLSKPSKNSTSESPICSKTLLLEGLAPSVRNNVLGKTNDNSQAKENVHFGLKSVKNLSKIEQRGKNKEILYRFRKYLETPEQKEERKQLEHLRMKKEQAEATVQRRALRTERKKMVEERLQDEAYQIVYNLVAK